MQVAFASLFLGLVLGVQPVELTVGPQVAGVELRLDGALVGRLEQPPWALKVDLGGSLAPHRLEAIAQDAEGTELSRAVQWLNLPRAQAEANVVFEGGEDGHGVVARVAWESVVRQEPRKVAVRFDGRPIEVADPRRIELPDHAPDQLHLLRVELEFSSNLSAVAERVFGGGYGNETATELTAVPVAVGDEHRDLSGEEMDGWFLAGDHALTPVAAEEGPAEVVLVMDREAQPELLELARRWAGGMADAAGRGNVLPTRRSDKWDPYEDRRRISNLSLLQHTMRLNEGQTLRFLWPFTQAGERSDVRYALFPRSEDHPPADGGVLWLLTAAQQPAFSREEQCLADAVAVAGMTAAARGRRRAVVLLLGKNPTDASGFDPKLVRHYLSDLGVPVHVWTVGEVTRELERAWGEVRSVRRESWFRAAVEDLARELEHQRIVWVDGLHLPQDVNLSDQARGLRLVR